MGEPFRQGKWWCLKIGTDEAGLTVEEVMKGKMHLSGRMLQKLTRMDGIRLNGRRTMMAKKVGDGDQLEILLFPEEDYGVTPEKIPLVIPYEDEHLLVVDKPAGLAVHPTEPGQMGTLANGLAFHYREKELKIKIRHIHRLDKETSGLLLVAKHALSHTLLDEALRERRIKRLYLALVTGRLTEKKGRIDLPIGRDRHHATRRRVSQTGDRAITEYEVIREYPSGSLVQLELKTGRTHQIRVHLSHIGHPLLGDALYGGDAALIRRQALHAAHLSFIHPFTGQELAFNSPLPEDMAKILEMWEKE